ncbi:hypothetical protein [Desulfomonile tiedjei]|uniref:Uncharacterized protein n=1 Tax=Desulfomonile tiedjei (strain ATCC 49306 / DSM 6799 / DCB-1) TaxID=706587 RepID=I4C8W8_DESTA|nr:hypothetical protein [Desulfomonile tiedjei]AFM26009.1 hypothetical protein Desti_3353 [Desulfomonile tiedjei DSM 6799]
MKRSFIGLVVTLIGLSLGVQMQCQAGGICPPPGYSSMPYTPGYIGPQSPYPTMPANPGHMSRRGGACNQAPLSCVPVPHKVRSFSGPESVHDPKLVPLYVRDPGPVRPIIQCTVGLAGAALALPFRIAEILCPVPRGTCKPVNAPSCGPNYPVPQRVSGCYPTQSPAGCFPVCRRPVTCAPGGPAVAPLPPVPCVPTCSPNLPPMLVEEYQFPALAPQNLLSGIWNLPGSLLRNGRFAGDIHKASPCAPPICR